MANRNCPHCSSAPSSQEPVPNRADMTEFSCVRCGTFSVSGTVEALIEHNPDTWPRFVLAGVTRRAHENGRKLTLVTEDDLRELVAAAPVPRTLPRALDEVLRMISRYLRGPTGYVMLNESEDYPLVFAQSAIAFRDLLIHLVNLGLITRTQHDLRNVVISLTYAGWIRLDELRVAGAERDQAFIAMWFHPDMDPCRDEGIVPALTACGYTPLVLSNHEHNGLIDDAIISGIRASGILVADFTGNRAGVYLEAGFAMGLGIPVVRCVRDGKDFADLHFDQEHYSVIRWTTPDDLRKKLERRIQATIPGRIR